MKSTTQVLIVGAGPVGMLTALRCAQAGIDTLVIESHQSLLPTTRAVVYMPVVIPVLKDLGIFDKLVEYSFLNRDGVYWRDVDGKPLANLPIGSSKPDEFGGVLLLGQWRLNELIQEALRQHPSCEVRFNTKCLDIIDDSSTSTVKVVTQDRGDPDSERMEIEAQYVLGTDGYNSTVRNILGLDFEGFTYPGFTMVGTDVLYDFMKHENYGPLNFIVDPVDWAVVAYTAQDGNGMHHDVATGPPLWRVAYVEDPTLPNSREERMKRAEEHLKKYCKSGEPYTVIRAEPYAMHQRCASQAIKGRVMLAGDALHSNNPIGGLGLTGGILDAFCYGNAFVRAVKNGDGEILKSCANSRLETWKHTTNKLSQANMARLYATDGQTVKQREQFFANLHGENREKTAEMVRSSFDAMMPESFRETVVM